MAGPPANMTSNGTFSYVYNGEGQLKSVTQSSTTTTYVYDADGKRLIKCAGTFPTCASATLYWTGMGNTLDETGWTGTFSEEYVFFNGKRVARRDGTSNTVHYFLADHLGSADVVTGATGAIEKSSVYYPFGGEIPVAGSSVVNPYKFTDKERDSESGLDNFGARYYSATIGRFTSVDPKMITARHLVFPQKWNRYSYVQNTPILRVDPDGMEDWVVFRTVTAGFNDKQWANAKRAVESTKDAKGNQNTFHMVEGAKVSVESYNKAIGTPDTNVVFVGHSFETKKHEAWSIKLTDENGFSMGAKGSGKTMDSSGTVTDPAQSNTVSANSVSIFSCNSFDLAPQYTNTEFTGVQSGENGTMTGTLDSAAAAFVTAGGGDAGASAANAQIEKSDFDVDTGDNVEVEKKRRDEQHADPGNGTLN